MAETDTHINTLIYLREALRDYFRDDPQVYVAGNLFLPLGEYLSPPPVGYRPEEGGYRREAGERPVSEESGLELWVIVRTVHRQ